MVSDEPKNYYNLEKNLKILANCSLYLVIYRLHKIILLGQPFILEVNRKEGSILFSEVLNTFYLRLCGIRHIR